MTGPIGLFDSGVGGLTILREIVKVLPQYDYLYLADNVHVPYGERRDEEIISFTKKAVDFFVDRYSPLVILACNTATAVALRHIQQRYLPTLNKPVRVLGIVRPTVEFLKETGIKRIGIMATTATVHSQSFPKEMRNIDYHPEIHEVSCPDLVPLIENRQTKTQAMTQAIRKYVSPFDKRVEAVLLGCTHYNYIESAIQSLLGDIPVYSEGPITARRLQAYLRRHPEIEMQISKGNKRVYAVTGTSAAYRSFIERLTGESHVQVQDVVLE